MSGIIGDGGGERRSWAERWLAADAGAAGRHLWARWIFLRGLGFIFLSAFVSLAFQIHGLIGPRGILPAGDYLAAVARAFPAWKAAWFAPTLLWISASGTALTVLVAVGLVASLALLANLWPRASIAVAGLCFLSFVVAARDFSSYQSDGMLLEAAFLSLFFAPPGLRPRLGAAHPPPLLALWLLRWEWFRIYFESGIVKLASGDPEWRHLTAMDEYYQNGPLPTWIGWYVQQRLPHAFHAATALATLVIELVLVWLLFAGRLGRLAAFAVVTPLQVGIILTANYAFLNHQVLLLGVLLLEDRDLARIGLPPPTAVPAAEVPSIEVVRRWRLAVRGAVLGWAALATVGAFLGGALPAPLAWPAESLAPFRVANAYGLFAVMTRGRYEIEFQGTLDGERWTPYPFRFKPQDVDRAPGLYAPYQPRFEWNLWFASLAPWQQNPWVLTAERRLLAGEPSVLALFADDPFHGRRPRAVRTVLWQYWFTDPATKRQTGAWWRRRLLGPFAPPVWAAAAPSLPGNAPSGNP